MPTPKISIEKATRTYAEGAVLVFENLDLQVNENETICIVGPSGCGKTTLLRCINPGIGAESFGKAWDDLSKGGIWAVNDGCPKDFIQYTIDKKVELKTEGITKDSKYEQICDLSVVNEAMKRLGGPLTGDPRWY